jgi:hypothetical protein
VGFQSRLTSAGGQCGGPSNFGWSMPDTPLARSVSPMPYDSSCETRRVLARDRVSGPPRATPARTCCLDQHSRCQAWPISRPQPCRRSRGENRAEEDRRARFSSFYRSSLKPITSARYLLRLPAENGPSSSNGDPPCGRNKVFRGCRPRRYRRRRKRVAHSAIMAKLAKSTAGIRMKSLTPKDAKYGFGRLIDLAHAEPMAVAKHGRPVVVRRTSDARRQLAR